MIFKFPPGATCCCDEAPTLNCLTTGCLDSFNKSFSDDFNDGTVDSSWLNSTSSQYSESGGQLTITPGVSVVNANIKTRLSSEYYVDSAHKFTAEVQIDTFPANTRRVQLITMADLLTLSVHSAIYLEDDGIGNITVGNEAGDSAPHTFSSGDVLKIENFNFDHQYSASIGNGQWARYFVNGVEVLQPRSRGTKNTCGFWVWLQLDKFVAATNSSVSFGNFDAKWNFDTSPAVVDSIDVDFTSGQPIDNHPEFEFDDGYSNLGTVKKNIARSISGDAGPSGDLDCLVFEPTASASVNNDGIIFLGPNASSISSFTMEFDVLDWDVGNGGSSSFIASNRVGGSGTVPPLLAVVTLSISSSGTATYIVSNQSGATNLSSVVTPAAGDTIKVVATSVAANNWTYDYYFNGVLEHTDTGVADRTGSAADAWCEFQIRITATAATSAGYRLYLDRVNAFFTV